MAPSWPMQLLLAAALLRGASSLRMNATAALEDEATVQAPQQSDGHRDLTFMHIPFNFGHTIEKVAMFDRRSSMLDVARYTVRAGGLFDSKFRMSWADAEKWRRPGGQVWGHFNPDLQSINPITGCNTFYTPSQYWPHDLAERYFGNKTVFGMLRDPYERLVSMFRGNVAGYGAMGSGWLLTCNVNAAVKHALKTYIASGNKFMSECTFLPQAEYFKGRHGIKLAVDNRRFPASANEVFMSHGYNDMLIAQRDIIHVVACPQVWAADLDSETKALVRQVYADDFELLCEKFGYCDNTENVCIKGVLGMCPVMRGAYMR